MLNSMALPKLELDDPPDDVLEEHVHSLTTMHADSLAASHAIKFDGLVTDWTDAESSRIKLVIAATQAAANAFRIDTQLNGIVDAVVDALKPLDQDAKERLQQSLLKGQPPSAFKRPILSNQLTAMSVWPSTLKGSSVKALEDIEKDLSALLPVAKEAETTALRAKQDLVDWKNIGRWKQHIDKSNADRASTYGALLEMPHNHPEARLPSDYADLFFLHDTRRRGANKPKSSKQIGEEIDGLETKLANLKKQHAEALAREAAEAGHVATMEQKEKELAALKQQEKENAAKRKQLEKELEKR